VSRSKSSNGGFAKSRACPTVAAVREAQAR